MPGEKDVTEKILEDYNDVFADIANNLLFGGREVISPEELETAQAVSQMKLEDGLHEQERDCVKHWKQGTIILAAIGYENQSTADQVMPLRTVSYDGGVYRTQVNRYNRERRQRVPHAPLYPAVTLVLYYGEKPWSGPRSLRECFPDLHPELEGLIPDYPLHLVEIARLTPEQVKGFKSDFRFIADYLVQMKNGGAYQPPDDQIVHTDETLKLLSAVTGDNRFQRAVNELRAEGKEPMNMCQVIDNFIQEGWDKARREYEPLLKEQEHALIERDHKLREMGHALKKSDLELREKDREILELRHRLALLEQRQ